MGEPTIIDGKKVAASVLEYAEREGATLIKEQAIIPNLVVILVGDDPASASYVRSKNRTSQNIGFKSTTELLPADTPEEEVLELIARLNADKSVHGILVQLPLPPHMDADKIVQAVDYRKDVDGLHPVNVGRLVMGLPSPRPCTPSGVIEMLKYYNIDTTGKRAVIVGRSNLVGKPLANLLMQKMEGGNAIVTVAHSAAKDLKAITLEGEILVAAIGRPGYITADMVQEGAVVIDVGINRVDDASRKKGYRVVGDVDFDSVAPKASAITPVPGGVGLMTVAMLMMNTLRSARGEFL